MSEYRKQTEVLLEAQSRRKEEAKVKTINAVQRLLKDGKKITFAEVARESGLSEAYLYKYPDIKEYIQQARRDSQEKSKEQLEREPGVYSQKTLLEVARRRIHELESVNLDLKEKLQHLTALVAEVHELRELVKRYELERIGANSPKVVNIRNTIPATKAASSTVYSTIEKLGIETGERLKKEIAKHSESAILEAVDAFKQYREGVVVDKPQTCLLEAIRDEWKLNRVQELNASETQEFKSWYTKAIKAGYCDDLDPKYLPVVGGKICVRVLENKTPGGYKLVCWREARDEITIPGKL